ncbi:hypothetical protein GCM10007424_15430 [Flavobacterium suaedae]|uniref:Lipoprotein n=1 Tax=Flavobacterium suaedae TaxID=1767027 RepID=A0ABQ1JTD6_9FLAO|nr:hypothetical protein [Flavobacterium suaedae]GGB76349.1 hypothetical protein GCM10007424_15430 [Flavobacterium suaedae]
MKSIHLLKIYIPILLLCFGCASQKKQLITPNNPFVIEVKSFKIDGEAFYQTQKSDTLRNNRSLPVKLYDIYYLQLVINEQKEEGNSGKELEYLLYETKNGVATVLLKKKIPLKEKIITITENSDEKAKIQLEILVEFK